MERDKLEHRIAESGNLRQSRVGKEVFRVSGQRVGVAARGLRKLKVASKRHADFKKLSESGRQSGGGRKQLACFIRGQNIPGFAPKPEDIGAKVNPAGPFDGKPVRIALAKKMGIAKRIVCTKCRGKIQFGAEAVGECQFCR